MGEKISNNGRCNTVHVMLQRIPYFYLLPLEDYDVVLGARWLRMLGLIIWNFAKLTIQFDHDGKKIMLRGLAAPVNKMVEETGITRELKKKKERSSYIYTPSLCAQLKR